MTLTRRGFLQTAGAATALGATGVRPGWARNSLTLGDMQIDTLLDGTLTLPGDFILGTMPQDELAPILARYDIDLAQPYTPPCNVTLMRDGDRVVLFDAGSGSGFQPSVGQLVDALDAIDVAVEDVTHVVFTHGHPDHLWGLLDDFDDPLFYEAEHMIGRVEFDYWMNPNTVDTIGEARASFAVGAQRRLDAMADQFTFFEDGAEILPGIAARASFGHTPGHMSFELRSGSDAVMVVGDAIGNDFVAFERPDWQSGSDQDAATAAATRTKLLDQLAQDQMRLIGYHLKGGGIGRAEKTAEGYRFVSDPA